jgi:hypothetical protein
MTMTDPTVETEELARVIRARLARLPASRVKQALAEEADAFECRLRAPTGTDRRGPPSRNLSTAAAVW